MSNLYCLFQTFSKYDHPLESEEFALLKLTSAELAARLAPLLKQNEAQTNALSDYIYSPLLSLDDPNTRLGRLIDQKYQIKRLLGQGGMSDVYLAKRVDGLVTHQVAVKYFALANNHQTALKSIKKEANILAQLDHPYIANFVDIGYDQEGEPNIMLEYIEGQSLFKYLQTDPDPNEIKRINQDIQEVKNYMYKLGVSHGDISVNNVIIGLDGKPNIIDFDLATNKQQII